MIEGMQRSINRYFPIRCISRYADAIETRPRYPFPSSVRYELRARQAASEGDPTDTATILQEGGVRRKAARSIMLTALVEAKKKGVIEMVESISLLPSLTDPDTQLTEGLSFLSTLQSQETFFRDMTALSRRGIVARFLDTIF